MTTNRNIAMTQEDDLVPMSISATDVRLESNHRSMMKGFTSSYRMLVDRVVSTFNPSPSYNLPINVEMVE